MKRTLGICILAAVGGAVLAAVAKPDFTGTWQLDPRSRFSAQLPAPTSMALAIVHHEPKLHFEIKSETGGSARNQVFDLTTDGTEVTQTNAAETCTASARWGDINGTRLMLTTKQQSPSGTVVTSREMKLGKKGKILTTVLTVQNQSGTHKAYEFYVRTP